MDYGCWHLLIRNIEKNKTKQSMMTAPEQSVNCHVTHLHNDKS